MSKEKKEEVNTIVVYSIVIHLQKNRLSELYNQIGFKHDELENMIKRIQELKEGIASLTSLPPFNTFHNICIDKLLYIEQIKKLINS